MSEPMYPFLILTNDQEDNNYSRRTSSDCLNMFRKHKLLIVLVGFTMVVIYILHSLVGQIPEDTTKAPNVKRIKSRNTTGIKVKNINLTKNASLVQDMWKHQETLEYLVSNERCRIPNISPYQSGIMNDFVRLKYRPCAKYKPLISAVYNATKQLYTLRVIKEHIRFYTRWKPLNCSYQYLVRDIDLKDADYNVALSNGSFFEENIDLPSTADGIIVSCEANRRYVYLSGYAIMPEREDIRNRINKWKSKDTENQQNATSVIMIGIDSLSRTNLIRAMPKLAQYLYSHNNEWFEMSGYNKIDDNTFPNLMAVLSGLNLTTIKKKCLPEGMNVLDNCSSIIWNTFREHGYVTAYGADETDLNAFNSVSHGLERQTIDFYLRPFLLMAEKMLYIDKEETIRHCVGNRDYSDYIFDYAQELVTRFKNDPIFGLFWMSSFSQNELNEPSSMDEHIVERLKNFMSLDAFDNTIVVFFSDHGLRYGPILKTLSGYYEERLPFMFLWLPQQLRRLHPEFVQALRVNKNRLTNPYDLHMTLKHVLAMSKRVTDQKRLAAAEDCPRCQTLFAPVPDNRFCDDIAIDYHWCTCFPFQHLETNTKDVYRLVRLTIEYMNHLVSTVDNGTWANRCRWLSLQEIDSAYYANNTRNKSDGFYRVNFYTWPDSGLFAATVLYNKLNRNFKVLGRIKRLDAYSNAYCISSDSVEKELCSCE